LLTPEDGPLRAGTRYATTAGVHVGSHEHTHFEFKIGRPHDSNRSSASARGDEEVRSVAAVIDFDDESESAQSHPEVLHLDPWIVFWQTFEDRKDRQGAIRAAMNSLGPARTGQTITFSAQGSRASHGSDAIACYWSFGDGGWEQGLDVHHVFARPAVYPITLVVDDGLTRAACTQHITITGDRMQTAAPTLSAPDEPLFRRRPVHCVDVYGRPVRRIPHTLEFVARPSRPVPRPKVVKLQNLGGGVLADVDLPTITYDTGSGWLRRASSGRLQGTGDCRCGHVHSACSKRVERLSFGECRVKCAGRESLRQLGSQTG